MHPEIIPTKAFRAISVAYWFQRSTRKKNLINPVITLLIFYLYFFARSFVRLLMSMEKNERQQHQTQIQIKKQ